MKTHHENLVSLENMDSEDALYDKKASPGKTTYPNPNPNLNPNPNKPHPNTVNLAKALRRDTASASKYYDENVIYSTDAAEIDRENPDVLSKYVPDHIIDEPKVNRKVRVVTLTLTLTLTPTLTPTPTLTGLRAKSRPRLG